MSAYFKNVCLYLVTYYSFKTVEVELKPPFLRWK